MLTKIILSIVVAIVVALVCVLIGGILAALNVDVIKQIGDFLQDYSTLIGILAGIWYFFSGRTFNLNR